MSQQVIDLAAARDEREPHMTGPAKCIGCGHRWQAVAPVGAWSLECPECQTMRGRWHLPIAPRTPIWTCRREMPGGEICGGDVWLLTAGGVYCPKCGSAYRWDVLAEEMGL